MNECVSDNSPEDNKDLYTCNTCIGMMPIMLSESVYQYFNPNFRRWWKELHEKLEKFFKFPLNELQEQGHYDPDDETHR